MRLNTQFVILSVMLWVLIITKVSGQELQSEFDVIVKKDNTVLYAIIEEVGLEVIKYRKTSMPQGPIFTLKLSEVFLISFRDQTYQLIDPVENYVSEIETDTGNTLIDIEDNSFFSEVFSEGTTLRFGIGAIKSFSAIDEASTYQLKSSGPGVFVGYSFPWRFLKIGAQMGLVTGTYSRIQLLQDEQVEFHREIEERLLFLAVNAKYTLRESSNLRPYVQAGLIFYSSKQDEFNSITNLNNPTPVSFTSSKSTLKPYFTARIGVDYYFTSRFGAFADLGLGPNLIQGGLLFRLKKQDRL